MTVTWHDYPDADTMARGVAEVVRSTLPGKIAVPGGSTPARIFKMLGDLDAHVTLTDERWVPHGHKLSNYTLLQTHWPRAKICPLVDVPHNLSADADAADARIKAFAPIDLAWLGVGGDGHTASWFPGKDLKHALNLRTPRDVVAVTPDPLPPEAPVSRLTLTLAAILRVPHILLVATGVQKREILEMPQNYPVGALLHSGHKNIHIHWAP